MSRSKSEKQRPHSRILFLCSGNYFRSRFSEELFNHWARRLEIPWQADSRGLIRNLDGLRNAGTISPHTIKALATRGISPLADKRWPQPVSREELLEADRVVALKEAEHRPMMQAHFPDLVERVEYWSVDDIDVASPNVGITQAEQLLLDLIRSLK